MLITIIIPCYNEIHTLSKIISLVNEQTYIDKEIILIDDYSVDGTRDLIKSSIHNQVSKVIYHDKNLGKGAAIRSGLKIASGEVILIQDADLEYNPKDLLRIVYEMEKKNYKIIYGSRVLKKSMFKNTQNFTHIVRIWGNVFLTKISNFLNNQKLTDAHTCYKVMNSKIFKKIKLNETGFSFCPEITTKISLMNLDIKEVPINYSGRTYEEGKKITAFDGLDALFVLIKYRFFR